MNQPTFAASAKYFIDSCCRQRLMLMRTGRSLNTDPHIYDIAVGMRWEIQTLTTDIQFAMYIRRKASDLIALMPGKNCKGIAKRLQEFNRINTMASNIINQNTYKVNRQLQIELV